MRVLLLRFLLLLSVGPGLVQATPTPPAQPDSGPGGSDYTYARVNRHSTGEGSDDATVFWPERGLDLDASSQEPAVTDTLDYYGTWKLFDALCTAAFDGKLREVALGGGPAQLDMGKWSDGTPVKPLVRLTPVAK